MDHVGFDDLSKALASRATRRVSLGLLAVGLLGLTPVPEDAVAGKSNKKRCKPVSHACSRKGKRCCGKLTCDRTVVEAVAGKFCCQREGTPCTSFESCCSGTCDSLVKGGTCAPCRGRTCSATRPCCGGEVCTNGYCGGCRDRATSCTSSSQCCFSDCTSGACLSAQGGRCARDVDCRSCYLGHNCTGACVNGSCAI